MENMKETGISKYTSDIFTNFTNYNKKYFSTE